MVTITIIYWAARWSQQAFCLTSLLMAESEPCILSRSAGSLNPSPGGGARGAPGTSWSQLLPPSHRGDCFQMKSVLIPHRPHQHSSPGDDGNPRVGDSFCGLPFCWGPAQGPHIFVQTQHQALPHPVSLCSRKELVVPFVNPSWDPFSMALRRACPWNRLPSLWGRPFTGGFYALLSIWQKLFPLICCTLWTVFFLFSFTRKTTITRKFFVPASFRGGNSSTFI